MRTLAAPRPRLLLVAALVGALALGTGAWSASATDQAQEAVITIVPPPLTAYAGESVTATVTVSGTDEVGSVYASGPEGEQLYNGPIYSEWGPATVSFDTRRATSAPQSLEVRVDGAVRVEEYPIDVRRLASTLVLEVPEDRAVGRTDQWAVGVRVEGPEEGPEGGDGRHLVLKREARRGWSVVDSARSRAGREVFLAMPTNWAGTHRLQVLVTRDDTHRAARVEVPVMSRARSYRPRAGSAFTYARTGDGRPARLDACTYRGLHFYTVNDQQGPRRGGRLVDRAMRDLGEATGLDLGPGGRRGRTDFVPLADGPRSLTDGAARVVVAWARPRQVPALRGRPAVTGVRSRVLTGVPWRMIGSAGVVLNARFAPPAGWGERAWWSRVLAHELGHVVGLGDVDDPRQVMHPVTTGRPGASYARGDLAGLRAVGRSAGCHQLWRGEDSVQPPAAPGG